MLVEEVRKYLFIYWSRKGFRRCAEDLAQEGVFRALVASERYDAKKRCSLKTYLINVGVNGGIDWLRREMTQENWKLRLNDAYKLVVVGSQRRAGVPKAV